jgi:hypothetical protein
MNEDIPEIPYLDRKIQKVVDNITLDIRHASVAVYTTE